MCSQPSLSDCASCMYSQTIFFSQQLGEDCRSCVDFGDCLVSRPVVVWPRWLGWVFGLYAWTSLLACALCATAHDIDADAASCCFVCVLERFHAMNLLSLTGLRGCLLQYGTSRCGFTRPCDLDVCYNTAITVILLHCCPTGQCSPCMQ